MLFGQSDSDTLDGTHILRNDVNARRASIHVLMQKILRPSKTAEKGNSKEDPRKIARKL